MFFDIILYIWIHLHLYNFRQFKHWGNFYRYFAIFLTHHLSNIWYVKLQTHNRNSASSQVHLSRILSQISTNSQTHFNPIPLTNHHHLSDSKQHLSPISVISQFSLSHISISQFSATHQSHFNLIDIICLRYVISATF